MKKTSKYNYPTWHWLWNLKVRRTIQLIGILTLLLVFYGLLQGSWILSLLLLPLLVALLTLGNDHNFKRGSVPTFIRKRMVEHFDSKSIHREEALYILNRVYEKSAKIAPVQPKDAWLSKSYFVEAFTQLGKAESDKPNEYMNLCKYITNKYY